MDSDLMAHDAARSELPAPQRTPSQIWDVVRRRLRSEVGAAVFESSLAAVSLISARNGGIELGLPTRFMGYWAQQNFGDRLEQLWREEWPETVAVKFVIQEPALKKGATAAAAVAWGEPGGGSVPPTEPPGPPTGTTPREPSGLNPDYTFEGFVQGEPNALALSTARALAESTKPRFTLLYLYGPTGVGKTHLAHAIGNAMVARNPDCRVRYAFAEGFVSSFVAAIRGNNTQAFKGEHRAVDLLILDDIRFIAGKEKTEEELFHTLNVLLTEGRRLVITADCAPGELEGFHERVRSRLSGGMTVEIGATDYPLRLDILRQRLAAFRRQQQEEGQAPVQLAPQVLEFIADKLATNVRVLDGAFNRVLTEAEFTGKAITRDFVSLTLKDLFRAQDKVLTIDEIILAVSHRSEIPVKDIKSSRRNQPIVTARHKAMWLARQLTSCTYPQIGRRFGRDHTSVVHAVQKVDDLRLRDSRLVAELDALEAQLRR